MNFNVDGPNISVLRKSLCFQAEDEYKLLR
jgi:hypothetical protein